MDNYMAIRVHKKEEAKSHIRFLKMGYAILQKTDIPFGGMAYAIFRQCADLSGKSL